ncbi:MAG: Carboxyl-terminal processing protease [Parcubacteria group bacterium]|nr:Carboxyl-terminal processing protease [Parcubacteria group bacterium]
MDEDQDVVPQTERPARRSYGYTMKLGIAFAVVLAVGFVGGVSVSASGNSHILANVPLLGDGLDTSASPDANLSDFWKVWNVLNSRYVQTHASTTIPDAKGKIWGAIEGLTAAYGDPYTVFFPPTEAKAFQEDITGNFGGIGAEIGKSKDNILVVIAPLKGTPSEKAGMRAGDLIIAIDGKSTEGLSTDEAVTKIRGPKGTDVAFTLVREGKQLELKVTRDTIQVPTIDNSYDPKTGVYYIALYQFTESSGAQFGKAFKAFQDSGSKKLIIDLRGDPGGYLDQATFIAGYFLPKGATVVTEDYKGKKDNLIHRSPGQGGLPSGTQIAVIMDQGSASASEILAGALQDSKAATLIGTRSFGKGSVQELVDVDGGSLKITIARWLTPSGRSISDGGLTPDIKVDRTQADYTAGKDPQKDRAVEFLTTGK